MRANVHLLRLAALSAFAGLAAAQVPAITSFTGATQFESISSPSSDQTIGFTFTANGDILVTALGVWDSTPADPLTQTHQVGLWTSGGTLLASATVLTTSPVTGEWRYVAITPVMLQAGQSYIAGSEITAPFSEIHSRVNLPGGTVTTSPLITIGLATANATAAGFSVPNITNPAALARFGPNLLVQAAPVITPPTPVPISPLALAAAGIGLALVAAFALGLRRPATPTNV
jgi:uncharacterized protein DUF4082